eukprot:8595062-Lingulodinium_polyedra.AAC.1
MAVAPAMPMLPLSSTTLGIASQPGGSRTEAVPWPPRVVSCPAHCCPEYRDSTMVAKSASSSRQTVSSKGP